jgi:hypothetical protein
MSTKKPSRRKIRQLCAEAGPGDGVDPRDERPTGRAPRRPDRKRRQLCRQVAETLAEVLAAQHDDLLRDLEVVAVEPGADRSRLLVTVRPISAEIAAMAALVQSQTRPCLSDGGPE